MPKNANKQNHLLSTRQLAIKAGAAGYLSSDACWLKDLSETAGTILSSYREICSELYSLSIYLKKKNRAPMSSKDMRRIDEALRGFLSMNAAIRRIKMNAKIGKLYLWDEDAENVAGILSQLREGLDYKFHEVELDY